MMTSTAEPRAHFSIPSLLALAAAVCSFFVGAAAGFALAIVAIILGVIGFALALSPRVRGGVVSLLSLIMAAIGIVVALIKAVAWLA
jgi:hypothetical protein